MRPKQAASLCQTQAKSKRKSWKKCIEVCFFLKMPKKVTGITPRDPKIFVNNSLIF